MSRSRIKPQPTDQPASSQGGIGRQLVTGLGVGLVLLGLFVLLRSRGGSIAQPLAHETGNPAWFEDVADRSGLRFQWISGVDEKKRYLPEIMGGGACWIDYDRDGDLDAYLVQGGRVVGKRTPTVSDQLFRNNCDGTFADVSAESGIVESAFGMGCATGDFDGDGWTDLYVTNVGPNALYRNTGAGKFEDVTTQAGVGDPGFSASASFLDFDRDGDLDLFVTNYVAWSPETDLDCRTKGGQPDYCEPTHYNAPSADTLYRNEGNGTFTNVSVASGIASITGNGLGVLCTDFDLDGWVDIAVANDEHPNFLWMNQKDGTFREQGRERGFAYDGQGLVNAGMGIEGQDIDADGDTDVLITHFADELNTMYVNDRGSFDDKTTHLGLSSARPFTAFGVGMHDFNLDGRLDIYAANGRVVAGFGEYYRENPYAEPNQLWRGLPAGGFEEVMPRGGTKPLQLGASRAAAFGDYDNDGRIDVLVVNRDAPAHLLRNVTVGGHWVGFHVLNRAGSPAIGAVVKITAGARTWSREVRTGYSYCAANDPRVHFGLGEEKSVASVEITWPDRTVQELGPFDADRYVEVRQSAKP